MVSDTSRELCQGEGNAAPVAPVVLTLTCLAPPPADVAAGDAGCGRGRRRSVIAARCVRPRPVRDWVTGRGRLIPCGRPRCSLECRDLWARRMSAALRLSFRALPPTHFV